MGYSLLAHSNGQTQTSPSHRETSIGFSKVTGILRVEPRGDCMSATQSLLDATPVHLGHTYLRRLHSLVRPPGLGTGLAPYLTTCPITGEVKQDLRW